MSDKQFQVSITTQTILTTLLIGVTAVILWTLRDLVLLVLTAVVIASAIEPGVAWFVRRKIPRIIAVMFMYLLVFGTLFVTLYVFVPPILDEAGNFVTVASDYLGNFSLPGATSAPSF